MIAIIGDILAILLLFVYVFVFHLSSLGSFLFEGYPDEKMILKPSEWLMPIILVGSLSFIYIKYLWGRANYKKIKIYLLVFGFSISVLLNSIWTILSLDVGDMNSLLVQLFVLAVTTLLLFYSNSKRKRLLN